MTSSVFGAEALSLSDSGSFEALVAEPLPERAADPAAVRRIVVENHAFVWRSLLRLGVPRADVDDALQHVFLVVSRRLADVVEGSERAFLYGVCLRVASRARRSEARRREVADSGEIERVDPGARPDELLERARARALLDEILEAMPLDLRSVFTLFELEQLTMVEIAELLGVPQGTVASRLRRARETFTEHRKRIEAKLRTDRALSCGRTKGGDQ
ncbi:MAG TPA: sigma-70 family RNA polymerase sigma factor [Polyangiaceae bacterium]|jgi:RNA polymerase sigma-70 factor (ECF subfamily)|nr:sigma-70 family RNA polymerase sigma factor [Polyangiaceae bacterium]